MKYKKLLTVGMSLAIGMGAVACSKKTENTNDTKTTPQTGQENTVADNNYVEKYSKYYGDYMTGLRDYQIYSTPESITEYYTTNEYPGNEAYLTNIRTAYEDSRDKMQSFVDSLKNDVKTEDAELKKMHENLIAEGEKSIANIDAKLKKLDEIPKDASNKSKEEYIKIVNETTTLKDETKNEFTKMLEDMNKKLGITNNK